MKVKIFLGDNVHNLSLHINHFIADKKVIDIKYSLSEKKASALVMYESNSEVEA